MSRALPVVVGMAGGMMVMLMDVLVIRPAMMPVPVIL
jgi:hypothetical protein